MDPFCASSGKTTCFYSNHLLFPLESSSVSTRTNKCDGTSLSVKLAIMAFEKGVEQVGAHTHGLSVAGRSKSSKLLAEGDVDEGLEQYLCIEPSRPML